MEEHDQQKTDSVANTKDEVFRVEVYDTAGKLRHIKSIAESDLATLNAIKPRSDASAAPSLDKSERIPIVPITSRHKTWLPSTQEFLTLTGSFGHVAKPSPHWAEGDGFDLITPTGVVSVRGKTAAETQILQQYVEQELGPQGLKDLLALLDTYDYVTREKRQQGINADVSLKEILQRVGLGHHAYDRDLQMNLLHTVRYLARSYIAVHQQKHKRMTPLLVLEAELEDPEGNVTIRYHLGLEFYLALYGKEPTRYALPTPQMIGYHSTKSKYEILFMFYLGARLVKGQTALYFTTLCLESQAYNRDDLLLGAKNRMRDAQFAIYALERLEKDGQICRESHQDVDTILAINVLQKDSERRFLAPATLERIEKMLPTLRGYAQSEQNTRRRIAFKRLLNINTSRESVVEEFPEHCTRLAFQPGPRLAEIFSQQGDLGDFTYLDEPED